MITVYMYTGENEIVSQENVDIFKIAADSWNVKTLLRLYSLSHICMKFIKRL